MVSLGLSVLWDHLALMGSMALQGLQGTLELLDFQDPMVSVISISLLAKVPYRWRRLGDENVETNYKHNPRRNKIPLSYSFGRVRHFTDDHPVFFFNQADTCLFPGAEYSSKFISGTSLLASPQTKPMDSICKHEI